MQSPRRYLSKTPKLLQSGITFPKQIIIFLESLQIKNTAQIGVSGNDHFEIYATIGRNTSSVFKTQDCKFLEYQIGMTENITYRHMRKSRQNQVLILTLIKDDSVTQSIQEVSFFIFFGWLTDFRLELVKLSWRKMNS